MNLSYLSRIGGIGGSIKNSPEDFIVEEIMLDAVIAELDKKIERNNSEGRFTQFILQKKNWSTTNAIREIAKRLRVSHTRFNMAGMKDKVAVTTQLVSVFGISPDYIRKIIIKDIQINGAWRAKEKIKLGDLLGNRFTIKINGARENAGETIEKIHSELNGAIPNYFGEQRFGSSRANTHLIGEKIIKGEFEQAVMDYIRDYEGEENEESKSARKEFAKTRDFKTALKTFPKHLTLERTILAYLAEHPGDYINALRRLPRNISLMFVHAFQSHLFNLALSERIANGELEKEEGEYFCGVNSYGFPDIDTRPKTKDSRQDDSWLALKLIGYESEINEREYELLERFGIKRMNFKIKGMPEISSKGTYRTAFAPLKDFSFSNNVFRFSLPSGSYATIAIREFLDLHKAELLKS